MECRILTYILLNVILLIVLLFNNNLLLKSTANRNNFNYIYRRCKKIINKDKCEINNCVFNNYRYGYEFYTKILNMSDCQLCQTVLLISHYIKCKNKKIITHRSYVTEKHTYSYNSNKLYGTDVIQKWILKKQNPQSCKNKKFLLIPYWDYGFGSEIHVMGSYLSLALESNRIAVINPFRNYGKAENFYCTKKRDFSCFFYPLTNCSVNITRNTFISKNANSRFKYSYSLNRSNMPRKVIPKYVLNFLSNSSVSPLYYLHYWRAQATRYLFRLRKNTTKIINKFINLNVRNNIKAKNNDFNIYPCVNVWIRHGDKKIEMRLIESSKYWSGIKVLERILNLKLNIYLSTDDRDAINYFILSNHSVFYLNYSRYNDNNKKWRINHIFNILSDIVISQKCIAYVGTRASNINRLIDELRSTSELNSNIPYFEMGNVNKLSINNSFLEIPEFW